MIIYPFQSQPTRGTTAIRYIGRTQSTSQASTVGNTYTFSNVNIGSPSGNTSGIIVIVGQVNNASSTTMQITGVTVGGISTTLSNRSNAGCCTQHAIFYINWVQLSTTATITVTTNTGSNNRPLSGSIAIYRLDNISNITPIQTNTNAGSLQEYSWTFTGLSIGDLVIAATSDESATSSTLTWTGLTENYDVSYGITSVRDSGASTRITTSGDTTFTRRYSQNFGTIKKTVSAVWR